MYLNDGVAPFPLSRSGAIFYSVPPVSPLIGKQGGTHIFR